MLKKIFLIFIVVFSFGYFAVAAEADIEQAKFIKELNKERRFTAILYRIWDMHELIFDEKLQNVASKPEWKKTVLKREFHGRYTLLKSYKSAISDLKEETTNFVKSPINVRRDQANYSLSMGHVRGWDHNNPLQTLIGCAPNNEMPMEYRKTGHTIVCVLGPEKSLTGWNTTIPHEAGSMCKKGYVNDDGLCSRPKQEPTSSTVPLPDTTPSTSASTVPLPDTSPASTSSDPLAVIVPSQGTTKDSEVSSPSLISGSSTVSLSSTEASAQQQNDSSPTVTQEVRVDHVPPAPKETPLDKQIAEYLRNEEDGDVPSEEDEEEEHVSGGSGKYFAIKITVVIVMALGLW